MHKSTNGHMKINYKTQTQKNFRVMSLIKKSPACYSIHSFTDFHAI